jgi:hypothetical protein
MFSSITVLSLTWPLCKELFHHELVVDLRLMVSLVRKKMIWRKDMNC